jgi:hypothetical protein
MAFMHIIFKEMVNCFLLKIKFTNHQKMLITYGAWEQERESRVRDRELKKKKNCWGNLSKLRYVSIKKRNWNWQAKELRVYQQKFKIHVALVTMFKAIKDYLEALHLHWTVLCHALVKVSEQLRCIWMAYITCYKRANLETNSWI